MVSETCFVVSIREKLMEIIFRSPERRKFSLFYFGGAALFLGMYLFMEDSLFAMTMFSGFLLTGFAEFLPKERNILAGVLRLTAIAVYTTALALSFIQPEVLF